MYNVLGNCMVGTLILAGSDFHSHWRSQDSPLYRTKSGIDFLDLNARQSGHEFLASHPVGFATLVSSPFQKILRATLRDVIFPSYASFFILPRKKSRSYPPSIERFQCYTKTSVFHEHLSRSIKKNVPVTKTLAKQIVESFNCQRFLKYLKNLLQN